MATSTVDLEKASLFIPNEALGPKRGVGGVPEMCPSCAQSGPAGELVYPGRGLASPLRWTYSKALCIHTALWTTTLYPQQVDTVARGLRRWSGKFFCTALRCITSTGEAPVDFGCSLRMATAQFAMGSGYMLLKFGA